MRQRRAIWWNCLTTALRSAARTPSRLARGELRWSGPHVGDDVVGPDGRRYVIFRETGCVPRESEDGGAEPTVLRAWFRLPWLGPPGSWRHRIFRHVCIVTVPLFSGLEGYRTKLWMYEANGAHYLGIYEWAGADAGRAYLAALEPLLVALSSRGSVDSEALPNEPLDKVIERWSWPPDRGTSIPESQVQH